MTKTKRKFSYYSFDKIYSYNATYMFVVGARGLGKTYGAKKKVIANFLKTGEQFIYLRRYSSEIKGRGTFFADVSQEFPNYHFRVHGHEAQIAEYQKDPKKRQWKTCGYFIQLSNAQAQKSVAYPAVTTIIFDEFIIERGALHYLPNEAKAFNDFYSTVDRWQDKTRVLFLANAVSIMNPYFLEYDIKPDELKEYYTAANGFIAAHFADSKQFQNEVYQTKFGQFIKGTDYADFSVGSRFSDNHDRLISLKPGNAKYYCSIETSKGIFSVWIDFTGPFFYIQDKRPKQETMYTFVPELMSDNKVLLRYNDKITQSLRTGFRTGRAFFSSAQGRNAFVELFRR